MCFGTILFEKYKVLHEETELKSLRPTGTSDQAVKFQPAGKSLHTRACQEGE
jgi:hypothetical protein